MAENTPSKIAKKDPLQEVADEESPESKELEEVVEYTSPEVQVESMVVSLSQQTELNQPPPPDEETRRMMDLKQSLKQRAEAAKRSLGFLKRSFLVEEAAEKQSLKQSLEEKQRMEDFFLALEEAKQRILAKQSFFLDLEAKQSLAKQSFFLDLEAKQSFLAEAEDFLEAKQSLEEKQRDLEEMIFSAILSCALKEGSIPLNIIKCLFQGPPRVGKTHVKCLLLRQALKQSLSTGCAEHPQRAIRNITAERVGMKGSEEEWEVMDDEMLASLIAQATSQLGVSINRGGGMKLQNGNQAAKDVVAKLQEKVSSSSSIEPVQSHQDFLYMIDSGGQPQFQEVLQAFIPNTTVLLIAFKLTEKLSDAPLMQHQSHIGSHDLGRYAITNEEIIIRFARMVYSSNSDVQVALLGTHYDQYSEELHETIKEKNSRLLKIFSFCKDQLLYHDLSSGSLLFPVSGLQAEEGKFDDPVICKLRSVIGSTSNDVVKVEVPLRWYAFELTLHKHTETTGKHILSKNECEQISASLNFPHDGLTVALEFLSKYNLILYYPTVLPNVVFTTPQVLLDKVTELTQCVYSLAGIETQATMPPLDRGEYLKMRDEGIISLRILRDFPKYYIPGLFTEEDLVKVFEHLYIIARLADGRFFMPALLPHFTPEDLKQLHNPSKPPLLFHFGEGCAPAGLFCAVLVCLTSPAIGWIVCRISRLLKGVRSNAACLKCPGLGMNIALVDSFSQFEVHYLCSSEREEYLCKVNEVITEALEEVVHNRKYNIALPKRAFFCRSENHPGLDEDSPLPHNHVAIPVFNKELECAIDSVAVYKMNEKESKWLQPVPLPPSTSNSPSMDQLVVELKVEAARWYTVGIHLQVPGWKLATIEKEDRMCSERLAKALEYWQKNGNPKDGNSFSWETVVDVLRKIENNALANKIENKYSKQ